MKIIKRIIIVSLSILIILPMFSSNIIGNTSTYSVEKDDTIIWTVTKAISDYDFVRGSKFRLKIDEIYNGTMNSIDGTILNCTFDIYDASLKNPSWKNEFTNRSLIVFNDTTHNIFIDFDIDSEIRDLGWLFIIPTPINFTWIGSYLNDSSYFDDYFNSSSTLSMIKDPIPLYYYYTFDNNGTLTEFQIPALSYKLVQGDIDIEDNGNGEEEPLFVPLGSTYLIIILFSIISIIIKNDRKICKNQIF